jgi:hypothetical protein
MDVSGGEMLKGVDFSCTKFQSGWKNRERKKQHLLGEAQPLTPFLQEAMRLQWRSLGNPFPQCKWGSALTRINKGPVTHFFTAFRKHLI